MSGGQRLRFADLDAVTIDAYGTLLELEDPVARLREALRERGVEVSDGEVERGFRAEVEYYVPRAHTGRDPASLHELRRECARTFLEAAGAPLDPTAFVSAFMDALRFRPLPGARATVRALLARGLSVAVVSNWDVSLRDQLQRVSLDGFTAVVTSAEAGSEKPDAGVFRLALERLGVRPERALHVGDRDVDERGAAAAGMRFAPAPLATAFAGWA